MADPVDSGPAADQADDGLLAAYLDGALDAAAVADLHARLAAEPALRSRLDLLRTGDRPFAEAYQALLAAAPSDRLQANLAAALSANRARPARTTGGLRRYAMGIAAGILLFALGITAGTLWGYLYPPQPGWRQVVAEYFVLVTPETLAVVQSDPAALSAELSVLGERLSLPLSADRLMLPEAELKRAQLYEFRGRPLVQVSYLVDAGEPMALCIIANGRPDAPLNFEEREGSNVVYWTHGGRGYMLIGKTPRPVLEAYAENIAAQLSS